MSRLSFRPRPLDIHKKLPIVKSFKDFEDDEAPASTRNSQLLRAVPDIETEVWGLYLEASLCYFVVPCFQLLFVYFIFMYATMFACISLVCVSRLPLLLF